MMKLKKICVVGMGLLGSSVTLSAKRELAKSRIVGYSHRDATRQKARQYEVAHEIADSLEQAITDADLVILATPIQTFEDYFKQIVPYLKDGCIVTDVGSTKTLPHQWASHLPKGVYYVGSHPIAGSEKRGVEYARDDLLANAKCILTKVRGTHAAAVEVLEDFWSKLGCNIQVMSPGKHDRIFGMVSHLPHIAAAAIINSVSPQNIKFAGRGFIDTTRVASGPSNVWTDILMTNSQTCVEAIEKLQAQLQALQDAIAAGDERKVNKILAQAGEIRAKLIQYKIDQKECF
ncbi:MAG: prephenate dehydrogenase [Planctomycetota bacterium]|jgi:prephenate dehydrogenase